MEDDAVPVVVKYGLGESRVVEGALVERARIRFLTCLMDGLIMVMNYDLRNKGLDDKWNFNDKYFVVRISFLHRSKFYQTGGKRFNLGFNYVY